MILEIRDLTKTYNRQGRTFEAVSKASFSMDGGDRRRVAIARAFVHDPKLVIADEPTSDLDEENTGIILDFFENQRKQGKAILISTHDLSCLRDGVSHYRMNKGVIQA